MLCDMKRYRRGAGRAKRAAGEAEYAHIRTLHLSAAWAFIYKTRRELSSYLSCLSAAQQEVSEKATTRLSVRNGWQKAGWTDVTRQQTRGKKLDFKMHDMWSKSYEIR